jgi:hypothetical protein
MNEETDEHNSTSQFDFCTQAGTSTGNTSPAKSPLMDVQNQLDGVLDSSPPLEPMCSDDIDNRPLHTSSSMPCSPARQLPESVDQMAVSSKNAPSTTVANRFPFNIRETMEWIIG